MNKTPKAEKYDFRSKYGESWDLQHTGSTENVCNCASVTSVIPVANRAILPLCLGDTYLEKRKKIEGCFLIASTSYIAIT